MSLRHHICLYQNLLAVAAILAFVARGQSPGTPNPKKAGVVRIGLLLPKNGLAVSGNLQDGEPVREAESMLLTGPALESVKLQAVLPEQALAEAKQMNCDYILDTTLGQQKGEATGRFGKLMNMRAMQAASSAAVYMPGGSSTAKQIGMMGGQVIQQQMAAATSGVKANYDVNLQYTLTDVNGTVAIKDVAKIRSKSDGENVVTPLLTQAATKIVAAAKPVASNTSVAAANANPSESSAPSIPVVNATLRTYQNYDFVPGDKITFEDDFRSTQDGEFPEKWELLKGQGSVNDQGGVPSFVINTGDPAKVQPRLKQKNYLNGQFTLEFDTFGVESQWGETIFFSAKPSENEPNLVIRDFKAEYVAPGDYKLEGRFPEDISYRNFLGKWHHIAIAYKQPQLKVYVDQYRVLYVPDMKAAPTALMFGGEATPTQQIAYRGVRLATGGGANYVGKKFTDAKIVTHGINFDVDKATLRPESMGALNQIAKLMKEDNSLKFEIDGHTDNSGASDHNLQLSDQRASAVKAQLTAMGIDTARLTTKGLGDTKPLGPNDSAEGKANNRRVEFVRM